MNTSSRYSQKAAPPPRGLRNRYLSAFAPNATHLLPLPIRIFQAGSQGLKIRGFSLTITLGIRAL